MLCGVSIQLSHVESYCVFMCMRVWGTSWHRNNTQKGNSTTRPAENGRLFEKDEELPTYCRNTGMHIELRQCRKEINVGAVRLRLRLGGRGSEGWSR
jgi:hypothetical protein